MTDVHDEHDRADPSAGTQADPARATPGERSEGTDTPPGSQEALQQPAVERVVVTHYGYDPQTFEILCRPGQRLSPKKVQRLQELELYVHLINWAE